MATEKKNTSQKGCGTIIIGLVLFYLAIRLLKEIWRVLQKWGKVASDEIIKVFSPLDRGAKICIIALALLVLIAIIAYVSFRKTHRKPLSYKQIEKLSKRYINEYFDKNYRFVAKVEEIDPLLQLTVLKDKTWYSLESPLNRFPASVASLFQHEEKEWTVVAIEKEGIVKAIWINRGFGNSNLFSQYSLNNIVEKCQQIKGYSILRFCSHQEDCTEKISALTPSEQEMSNAKDCSEIVCQKGFNWYDFICSKGRFAMYHSQVSSSFKINGKDISSIINIIDITPAMDYKMQKEYYKLDTFKNILKNKVVVVWMILLITTAFLLLIFLA